MMSLALSLLDSRRDLCQHTPALMILQVRCQHEELPRRISLRRQTQHDAKSTAEEYRS